MGNILLTLNTFSNTVVLIIVARVDELLLKKYP